MWIKDEPKFAWRVRLPSGRYRLSLFFSLLARSLSPFTIRFLILILIFLFLFPSSDSHKTRRFPICDEKIFFLSSSFSYFIQKPPWCTYRYEKSNSRDFSYSSLVQRRLGRIIGRGSYKPTFDREDRYVLLYLCRYRSFVDGWNGWTDIRNAHYTCMTRRIFNLGWKIFLFFQSRTIFFMPRYLSVFFLTFFLPIK